MRLQKVELPRPLVYPRKPDINKILLQTLRTTGVRSASISIGQLSGVVSSFVDGLRHEYWWTASTCATTNSCLRNTCTTVRVCSMTSSIRNKMIAVEAETAYDLPRANRIMTTYMMQSTDIQLQRLPIVFQRDTPYNLSIVTKKLKIITGPPTGGQYCFALWRLSSSVVCPRL